MRADIKAFAKAVAPGKTFIFALQMSIKHLSLLKHFGRQRFQNRTSGSCKPLTGDCLTFKLKNGNYGGAVVLATDTNPETAYNLVATTRLNLKDKPTPTDFQNAEVLVCNFGEWQDKADVTWYMPDLYHKDYSDIYELVARITVDLEYDTNNYDGKGYLFKPSWTAGWSMNNAAQRQFDSELSKPKPTKTLTIEQLTKKDKWWKVF
jgi:hypothetical protein